LQVFFYLTKKKQSYNLIYAAVAEEEISGEKRHEKFVGRATPE